MKKNRLRIGKKITAFMMAAVLMATGTDYTVLAQESNVDAKENVQSTETDSKAVDNDSKDIQEQSLQQAGTVEIANNGYAYARDMNSNSITLVAEVENPTGNEIYQWEQSSSKNGSYTAISGATASSYRFTPSDGKWYRCRVNNTTYTKPIATAVNNGSIIQNATKWNSSTTYYITNGTMAYYYSGSKFDIIGKYVKNNKVYWLQSSFSGDWQMYSSSSDKPGEASGTSSADAQLDALKCTFNDENDYEVGLEADLKDGQRAFAFGCDTMLGSEETSNNYADKAALNAIKKNGKINQVQMVGAASIEKADENDTSLVIKYSSECIPTYYWLGGFSSRMLWTNSGSSDKVEGKDSGMTTSWCNMPSGGSVKFSFYIGPIKDTGAVFGNATASTTEITVSDMSSDCVYALFYEDGTKATDWIAGSRGSYTFTGLKPDTKYVVKSKKVNADDSTSKIVVTVNTQIDPSGGAGDSSGDTVIPVKCTSSATTLKFENLNSKYKFCLQDADGRTVGEPGKYTEPVNGCIEFSKLSPYTEYYLVAKGTSGAESARDKYTTKKAIVFKYDANGGDGSMPDSVIEEGNSSCLAENTFVRENKKFTGWNTSSDGRGISYTDKQNVTNESTNEQITLYAQWMSSCPVTFQNDGYAYGSNMNTYGVSLVTEVSDESEVGCYQWQMAPAKEATEWENISDVVYSTEHTNKLSINSANNLKDGYWYRCVVNEVSVTKPVQLVKANGNVMTNVTRPYSGGQWYVSNGYVAYTSTGLNFDVLGKYEKDGTYYWLQTSYWGGWRMYTSTSQTPAAGGYYSSSSGELAALQVAFSDTDNFNMIFNAKLKDNQKSFAFGCDTMLGNYRTSGAYSDYASLKAIKEGDAVKQIQMVGAYSVDTAKATDTSFVLKYVDGYAPSYYWLGRYYSRQVWTNSGSIDDVINTDSGMTSSWCNVTGGNVLFEFHVGAVADTGAKITICAKSEKNSITVYNPDSNCKYSLYKVGTDGTEEEVSPWTTLPGDSYTYDNLSPDTKYVLKVQKNGETFTSQLYTKIDTEKGANEEENNGKIADTSTSKSLTFSNLRDGYQYALEDAYGNRVTGYKTPESNSITFDGLKAGNNYYLVAKSDENNLSERVQAATQKAVIKFDANVPAGSGLNVSDTAGMPSDITKNYGVSVVLPGTIRTTPSLNGYQFAGWTTADYKNSKYVLYRAGSRYYGENDVTLYAVWYNANETINENETYTVNYNANIPAGSSSGGNVVNNMPQNGTKSWGIPFNISSTVPELTGLEFKGWNTSSDGTGTSYNAGDEYLLNANLTLYAVWGEKYQNVTIEESERYDCKLYDKSNDNLTLNSTGNVKYGNSARLVFTAKDGYDLSEIKVYCNGNDAQNKLEGTLSDDKRTYTVDLSGINEDKYITASDIYRSEFSITADSSDIADKTINFDSKIEYYLQAPAAKTVTITNTGSKAITFNKPVSRDADSKFEISDISIAGSSDNASMASAAQGTFTIQPKAGLEPGIYTETVDVTTTTNAKQSFEVTFVVEKDNVAPTGTVTAATLSGKKEIGVWNTLLNSFSYNIYLNSDVMVSVEAEDSGSGMDSISYCTAFKGMTRSELDGLAESAWKNYSAPCTLTPYQTVVFYARLKDKAGNVTYLSTDGIVLDDVAPVIDGITSDESYCEDQAVTVTDENLSEVSYSVNGTDEQKLSAEADGRYIIPFSQIVTLRDTNNVTITARDKAGNATQLTVEVKHDYSYSSVVAPTIFDKGYTIHVCRRNDHECGASYKDTYVAALGTDGLVSDDKEGLQQVIEEADRRFDNLDLTEEEKQFIEDVRNKAQDKLDVVLLKELENAKDKATEEINQKADDARNAIDAMPDLTEAEKEEAKAAIDKKAEEAKKAIEEITDPSQMDDVTSKKDEAIEEIKKHKDDSTAKNDTNAEENVKKAEEAVEKTTEIIDDIKVSATDEESIMAEVKEELKKADIDNVDIVVNDFNKIPAKLHEKGKVTGTIEIKAGSTTKTVPIDRELPELSAFVKYENRIEADAPKAEVTVDENILMDKVLKEDNIESLVNGSNADIYLHIQNNGADVTDKEMKAIEGILTEKEQVGKYLDISLYLNVVDINGEAIVENEKIHDAGTAFKIKVSVPEELLATENVKRTFQIVRVHDGKAEILESVYDDKDHTLTFETDKFSTYAIVYTDEQIKTNPGTSEITDNTETGNTQFADGKQKGAAAGTADRMQPGFWIMLLMVSSVGCMATFGRRKRKNKNCK